MRAQSAEAGPGAGVRLEVRPALWLFLLALTALGSCAAQSPPMAVPAYDTASPAALEPAVAHRLYFGRATPDGGLVSEPEWETFLDEVVGPHFPKGFTVWDADGRWQEQPGNVLREPTFVLEVVRPRATPDDIAIRLIAREYRLRFDQEAVLWVRANDVLMSIESE